MKQLPYVQLFKGAEGVVDEFPMNVTGRARKAARAHRRRKHVGGSRGAGVDARGGGLAGSVHIIAPRTSRGDGVREDSARGRTPPGENA